MGVVVDSDVNPVFSESFGILARLSSIFLISYIFFIAVYTFFDGIENNYYLFVLFLVSPTLTAILIDNYWNNLLKRTDPVINHMFRVVKKNRLAFIFAGFGFSFMIILISIPLRLLLIITADGKFSTTVLGNILNTKANFLHLIAFIIASLLSGIATGASFYRPRGQDITTGKRYTFISSPLQITTLVSYGFIGTNFGFWLMWMASRLQFPGTYTIFSLELVTLGNSPLFMGLFFLYFYGIIRGAQEAPHFNFGSRYKIPEGTRIKEYIREIFLVILITSVLMYSMLDFADTFLAHNTQLYLDYLFLIFIPIFIFRKGNGIPKSPTLCNSCNLLKNEEGECIACRQSEREGIPFKLKINKKIYHPTCPSCGQIWDNPSRRCKNCSFTIILSCNRCGQTLNPLWTKCNQCGIPRQPIPQVALQAPGSPSYVRSQASLLVLVAYLFPTAVLQITLIVATIDFALKQKFTADQTLLILYDDIARLIALLIITISVFALLILSFNDKRRGVVLLANRFILAPGSILVLTAVIIFFFASLKLTILGLINLAFGPLVYLLFSALLLLGVLYSYYSSLIQFRPVLEYDQELDRNYLGVLQ